MRHRAPFRPGERECVFPERPAGSVRGMVVIHPCERGASIASRSASDAPGSRAASSFAGGSPSGTHLAILDATHEVRAESVGCALTIIEGRRLSRRLYSRLIAIICSIPSAFAPELEEGKTCEVRYPFATLKQRQR